MKVQHATVAPAFIPVTITLTFEHQVELDTFTALMARTKKVPDAVLHEDFPSKSTESLLSRGIDGYSIRALMNVCFKAAIGAGGKP